MKTLYECEVCGTQYANAAYAQYCENFVMPEAEIKIGDEIDVQTRYDGIERDTVIAIEIEANPYYWNPENVMEQYKQEYLKQLPHSYVYVVKNRHQTGKDTYTNRILLD